MMIEDPFDMVEEMEEMFDRLFSRMDQEFMTGPSQVYRHRIMTREREEPPFMPEDASPEPGITVEPLAEVHCVGDEVKVVTGLPGITDDTLRLSLRKNRLIIDAGDANLLYHASAALPPVDFASMTQSLKNGVLEVTFRRLPEHNRNS